MAGFLHERADFEQLLLVLADTRGIDPMLVEKDYWIMHCLWGLQAQGFQFELKGGEDSVSNSRDVKLDASVPRVLRGSKPRH